MPTLDERVSSPAQMNAFASSNGKANGDSLPTDGVPKKTSPEQDRTQVNGSVPEKTSPDQGRNQVKGIVRQFNGASNSKKSKKTPPQEGQEGTALDGFSMQRAGAPSEAGTTDTAARSVAETTSGSSEGLDRREPVKMKRKVPG